MSAIMSIYIPRISFNVTEEFVKTTLMEIGNVERVDFTPVNKKPGFNEKIDMSTIVKSAFVHFSEYHVNTLSIFILETLEKGNSYNYYTTKDRREYWILLKNKNPVVETMMNNHQIVENCRFLEEKVRAHEETIKNLEDKIKGLHTVVSQLVGGLFNQWSQEHIITTHMSHLGFVNENGASNKCKLSNNSSEWTIWPTTRQGDLNETRIKLLEDQMRKSTELLYYLSGQEVICEPQKLNKKREYDELYSSTWSNI